MTNRRGTVRSRFPGTARTSARPSREEQRELKRRDRENPEKVIAARRQALRDRAEIGSFFSRLIALVVILWVGFTFFLGITAVADGDMEPKLSAGDLVLYYRLQPGYMAEDVVVYEADGEQYIGRIVAKGGDSVEITDSASLVVNGSTVIESDIFYSTPAYDSDITYPLTLAEDEYFILSDYRQGGTDSRYHGAIPQADIKGLVIAAIRREGF